MPVITLSREMGSGGDDIAVEVARRLGLRLAGRDVINQAARQAGVPDVALADIDELGLLGVKPGRQALQRYRETAEQLIGEMADAGEPAARRARRADRAGGPARGPACPDRRPAGRAPRTGASPLPGRT